MDRISRTVTAFTRGDVLSINGHAFRVARGHVTLHHKYRTSVEIAELRPHYGHVPVLRRYTSYDRIKKLMPEFDVEKEDLTWIPFDESRYMVPDRKRRSKVARGMCSRNGCKNRAKWTRRRGNSIWGYCEECREREENHNRYY